MMSPRKQQRVSSRERFDVANAWRLVRMLQGALNRLPERELGRLADLRDTLEKFHESRSIHPKCEF